MKGISEIAALRWSARAAYLSISMLCAAAATAEALACPAAELVTRVLTTGASHFRVADCGSEACIRIAPVKNEQLIKLTVGIPTDRAYAIWVLAKARSGRPFLSVAIDGDTPSIIPGLGQELAWHAVLEAGSLRRVFLGAGPRGLTIAGGNGDVQVDCVVIAAKNDLRPDVSELIEVDAVWSGSPVPFSAVAEGSTIHIAYFDRDRWLSVASVNASQGTIVKTRIPSQFAGWDAHNSTAIALDGNGTIHVAGNMHASTLVYARGSPGGSHEGLARLRSMTKDKKLRVTYPQFLRRDEKLFFIYRAGVSGNGDWWANEWNGTAWERLKNEPFLAAQFDGRSVNAYPTPLLIGPNGHMHMALVWRLTPDVETNMRVSYAVTKDFETWQDASGQRLSVPLSPRTVEVIDDQQPGSALLNNQKIGLDYAGRPVVAYSRLDEQGNNQVYVAVPGARSGWRHAPITHWSGQWKPSGAGTIVGKIGFGVPESAGDCCIVVTVWHWQLGANRVTVRLSDLHPTSTYPAPELLSNLDRQQSNTKLADGRVRLLPITDRYDSTSWLLRWETLDARRDIAPNCSDNLDDKCQPASSKLLLIRKR